MKAVRLDSSEVGAFYNGDSYLVLDNRGEQGADLHMWIGESCLIERIIDSILLAFEALNKKCHMMSCLLETRVAFVFQPKENHLNFRRQYNQIFDLNISVSPISALLHPTKELSTTWCLLHI